MNELRWALRVAVTVVKVGAWVIETLWIGAILTWRLGMLLSRSSEVMADVRRCPRGHGTAMYGVYECRCGALVEDWVFARCRVCGQSAGWTPCTTCGLPIRNPFHA